MLLHPDDVVDYAEAFHRAVLEHIPFSREVRIRRADGEWRWLASYAEPRFSARGEYMGHVGLCPDVTEHKQAEQAVRDSQELAQSTIDALSSHVCVLNEAGTIVAVNQAWKDFAKANRRVDSDEVRLESSDVDCEGANYLTACDRAVGTEAKEAAEFAAGIRAVLHGHLEHFEQEYPCHSAVEQRWFVGRVRRFSINRRPQILIEHVIITERKLYETELIHAREAADARSRILEKINQREPLGDVLGTVSSFLTQQFPGSDCCIHLSVGRDYLELVPESCSSPDLRRRLSRVAIAARGEICSRAAIDSKCTVDREPQPAYSWPVLDANSQILHDLRLFTPRGTSRLPPANSRPYRPARGTGHQ